MVRHWICVTSPANWSICRKESMWGCEDEYVLTLKRLKRGEDILIFYVTRVKEFKGIFNISEKGYYHDPTPNWENKLYPHRIGIEPILEASVPIKACFEDLLFITNRKIGAGGWSDHLQFSMVSIREEDYNTIYTLMKKQKEAQTQLFS